MHFPKKLYDAFAVVAGCQLIRTRTPSSANLAELQAALNSGQPDMKLDNERVQWETVQAIYQANRTAYPKMVGGTPVEASILWTEAKTIVRHFGLHGLVYLSHDEKGYTAAPHEKRTPIDEGVAVAIPRAPRPYEKKARGPPKHYGRAQVRVTTPHRIERAVPTPVDNIQFEN